MRVEETPLPGIGLRHDFTTSGGDRLGVISHRTGRKEVLLYDRRDPDACRAAITIDGDDARTLADLLAPNEISARLGRIQQEIEGMAFDWVSIGPASPVVGRSIADSALRSRTGATIVVVSRGAETVPSPDPAFVLAAGDMVVVVGATNEVAAADRLLRGA